MMLERPTVKPMLRDMKNTNLVQQMMVETYCDRIDKSLMSNHQKIVKNDLKSILNLEVQNC